MQHTKRSSMVIVISFFLLLIGFSVAALCLPDKEISESERRYYEKFPKLSAQAVMDGTYIEKLEKYLLDHFAGRDAFRIAKTELETSLFGKKDANHYVKEDGYLFELDWDWGMTQVTKTAKSFAKLTKEWFFDDNVYFAVIPDKASFLPKDKYPVGTNLSIAGQFGEYLEGAKYIDISSYLSLEDYYKTDLHWKQEAITDVAGALLAGLGAELQASDAVMDMADTAEETKTQGRYNSQLITSDFYGGYAGASAYDVAPDELIGLTNDVIDSAIVFDYETGKETTIYAPEKVTGTDPYDYYLWGARALLSVKNPLCENGKKLLLFRDSFGSSMAPLLLEGYEEITLVDLRYVTAAYLPQLISLEEYDDVLILYSENVLRNSGSLKF